MTHLSNRSWTKLAGMSLAFYSVCAFLICSTHAKELGSKTYGPLTIDQQIDAYLESGEFNQALNLAGQIGDTSVSDRLHSRISSAQFGGGAKRGALQTAGLIEDNHQRYKSYSNMYGQSYSNMYGSQGNSNEEPNFSAGNDGNQGGITAADFDDLMDLIRETIDPDSWEEAGGTGRMRPFASGVFVDSSGTLNRINPDELRNWNSIKQNLNVSPSWQMDSSSDLRKISINRLERELMKLHASGQQPTEELKNLGGIYDLQYVMVYPETGDLVIAGPAGPWRIDEEGRTVNIETGRPVLQLDDLVVCIRNAWEGNGTFGCSIDPRQENLADVQKFLSETKLKGETWSETFREKMGQQDITVHGIDARTHAGQVIVEADYRMKLIGMGLEETIHEVPSYLDRVQADENGKLPPVDVIRWWFTMNYDGISASPTGDVFQLNGSAVKVQSETEFLNDRGERVHTGKSQGPTLEFAQDFTEHYQSLVNKYSIYGELENVFDLSLAANLIKQKGLANQVGWTPTFFASPQSNQGFSFFVSMEAQPTVVDSVINERVFRQTIGSRKLKHRILGVSGGVEFDANDYVSDIKVDSDISVTASDSTAVDHDDWRWE